MIASWFAYVGVLIACERARLDTPKDEPPIAAAAKPSATVSTPSTGSSGPMWADGPPSPGELGDARRMRIVLLSAGWCQWCRIFEAETLPDPEVATALAAGFQTLHVDIERSPLWTDIHGFQGLPALAFFDEKGRHVLTRSGYRAPAELVTLLAAVRQQHEAGALSPYPQVDGGILPDVAATAQQARAELDRLRREIFVAINSNDGGFSSPARDPRPQALLALQRWREEGGPPEIDRWLEQTIESSLRGHSPRLDGDPLPDLGLGAADLVALSAAGPDTSKTWRTQVERLPQADPYRGIQDPVDRGVFRYAAGPGWYNPHFERRTSDNLAWVLLLRQRGDETRAKAIEAFIRTTFVRNDVVASSQVADPFHARLRADERHDVPSPTVIEEYPLAVQALAARVFPQRCPLLLRIDGQKWPLARWNDAGPDPTSGDAPVDAVGELLLALAECHSAEHRQRATMVATRVIDRWSQHALPRNGRLFRLAAGLCAATPQHCGRALLAIEGLPMDLEHPPPLAALARAAR